LLKFSRLLERKSPDEINKQKGAKDVSNQHHKSFKVKVASDGYDRGMPNRASHREREKAEKREYKHSARNDFPRDRVEAQTKTYVRGGESWNAMPT